MEPREMSSASLPSPQRLFLKVLAIVFFAEAAVMFLLSVILPGATNVTEALVDACMLTILIAPFLWWFIARPLRSTAMTEKVQAAAVIANVLDGIITINEHGIVETFNAAAERIFGYTRKETIGQNIKMLMPSPYREAHDAHIANYLRTGEKSIIGIGREVEGLRKDGTVFPMDIAVSEVRLGNQLMFVGIVRDITERKRAEGELKALTERLEHRVAERTRELEASRTAALNMMEEADKARRIAEQANEDLKREITNRLQAEKALRRSERNYAALVNSIDGIVWEADAQTFQFTFVSNQAERLLGYPVERWLKDSTFWKDHIHPDDRERAVGRYLSATKEKKGHDFEYRMIAADGRAVWLRDIISVVVENDQPVNLRGMMVDVTKKKQAAEKLKTYAAELERSNRDLQDFASVASHDLQEPLRKIQAFGDRLKKISGAAMSDEEHDCLERMQKAAIRMRALINDLMTYSRVTDSAQSFIPVDLTEVTREVLSDLEVSIERVHGHVEVGNLPKIEADPLQMRQMLQNLIDNALKFHRKEEAPVVKVTGELLNGKKGQQAKNSKCANLYQIVVQDHGIGFDEKYLDRIFTLFQRLHGRSQYEGTGMGLAICRKICEIHNGSITAKSKPGQGATFIVTLPVKQTQYRKPPGQGALMTPASEQLTMEKNGKA